MWDDVVAGGVSKSFADRSLCLHRSVPSARCSLQATIRESQGYKTT